MLILDKKMFSVERNQELDFCLLVDIQSLQCILSFFFFFQYICSEAAMSGITE